MNVVEIEHLTYAYPGAAEATLNDVSLTIEKGDFLAIVGNNGCGKSTLCKTLNGLIPQFITGEYTGRVTACGLDAAATDIGARGGTMDAAMRRILLPSTMLAKFSG